MCRRQEWVPRGEGGSKGTTHDVTARKRVLQTRRERDVVRVRLRTRVAKVRVDREQLHDRDVGVVKRRRSLVLRVAQLRVVGATAEVGKLVVDVVRREKVLLLEVRKRVQSLGQDPLAVGEVGQGGAEGSLVRRKLVEAVDARLELEDVDDAGVVPAGRRKTPSVPHSLQEKEPRRTGGSFRRQGGRQRARLQRHQGPMSHRRPTTPGAEASGPFQPRE